MDREIPVIGVFRRPNFQLPVPAPIIENNNLSPDHHFGNDSEMEDSDHENYYANSPFYDSDSDTDIDDGEVVNEVRSKEEINPFKYVDPRIKIEKDSLFNMQFPCKIGYHSFYAYLNFSLPMTIICRANYNEIMVGELDINEITLLLGTNHYTFS